MTSNTPRKRQIRAYMAEHHVPYMQARRAVEGGAADSTTGPRLDDPDRVIWIQRGVTSNGSLPYEFGVMPGGTITFQDFWRGQTYNVIGFTDDPESRQIDLYRRDFVTDPGAAVGKYLVAQDTKGTFALYHGAIESVRVDTYRLPPVTATFRALEAHQPGAPAEVYADVAHHLCSLTDEEIVEMRENAWVGTAACRFLYDARNTEEALAEMNDPHGRRGDSAGPVSDFASWAEDNAETEWLFTESDDGVEEETEVVTEAFEVLLNAREAEAFLTQARHMSVALPTVHLSVTLPGGDEKPVRVAVPFAVLADTGLAALARIRWGVLTQAPYVDGLRAVLADTVVVQQAQARPVRGAKQAATPSALMSLVAKASEGGLVPEVSLDEAAFLKWATGWFAANGRSGVLSRMDTDEATMRFCAKESAVLGEAAQALFDTTYTKRPLSGADNDMQSATVAALVAGGASEGDAQDLVARVLQARAGFVRAAQDLLGRLAEASDLATDLAAVE